MGGREPRAGASLLYKIILVVVVITLVTRGLKRLLLGPAQGGRVRPGTAVPPQGDPVKDVPETDYKWRRKGDSST
jgi:hypothetical protein